MVSAFNSKNSGTFVIAKSILEKNQIPFIPKGENLAGLEYTQFELLVKEEDFEKAKEFLADIQDNGIKYQERFEKKHQPFIGYMIIAGILAAVAALFLLGLWIRE
ncbi:MAG: DUF2007 domain-containing protein [Bacteroidetes bacterium]|nr:DUF2007 domain-containing protein [Bacteroidota bacterium]